MRDRNYICPLCCDARTGEYHRMEHVPDLNRSLFSCSKCGVVLSVGEVERIYAWARDARAPEWERIRKEFK